MLVWMVAEGAFVVMRGRVEVIPEIERVVLLRSVIIYVVGVLLSLGEWHGMTVCATARSTVPLTRTTVEKSLEQEPFTGGFACR
jgi:hypothetical protein